MLRQINYCSKTGSWMCDEDTVDAEF